MNNIIYIRVPFISAINTYNIIDIFNYGVSISGSYNVIPFGSDSFDLYATGTGNQGGLLYFSGSGFWLGSGYTIGHNLYFTDTFNNYQTGLISGFGVSPTGGTGILYGETGLSSGVFVSGYNSSTNILGYVIWSGYL